MLKVKLLKAWGPHAKGDVIEVDDERAIKLHVDGWTVATGGYVTPRAEGVRMVVAEVGETVTVPKATQ